MRTRGLQPRPLYTERFSIKIEGQIKIFPDKRSLKNISPPNQLSNDAKGDAFRKGRKREKEGRI